MYRRLQSNFGKTKEATYTASEAMVKGMLVVKDVTTKKVALPSAAAGTGVFIVDVEPAYTGLDAVKTNISDYATSRNTIAEDDYVTLELLEVGEVYTTDQFTATSIVAGSYLQVGTDGKLAVKGSGTSPLVAVNPAADDAGHTVLEYVITDTAWA